MIRRWAAWFVVVVALAAMAVLRLTERKQRIPREKVGVSTTVSGSREPARSEVEGGP